MLNPNINNLLIVSFMGLIYGGLFYPFYSEFIEFGQVLSGQIEVYNINGSYINRDNSPSFLYFISKILVQNFHNIQFSNLLASFLISLLSFVSVYNFSERFLPNGKYNIFIPLGLT